MATLERGWPLLREATKGLTVVHVLVITHASVFYYPEPVVTEGSPEITILADGWTAVTQDNSWSAQFEHTVLVTAHGVEILT